MTQYEQSSVYPEEGPPMASIQDYNDALAFAARQGIWYQPDADLLEKQLTQRWNGVAQEFSVESHQVVKSLSEIGLSAPLISVFNAVEQYGVRTKEVYWLLDAQAQKNPEAPALFEAALDPFRMAEYAREINRPSDGFDRANGLSHARQLYLNEGASSDRARIAMDVCLDKVRFDRAKGIVSKAGTMTAAAEVCLNDASSPVAVSVMTAILKAKPAHRKPSPLLAKDWHGNVVDVNNGYRVVGRY